MTAELTRFPDVVLTPKPSGSYEVWCGRCKTHGWAYDRAAANGFALRHERCRGKK